ncbi:MAG: glutaminase [Bacteroidetes bacterium]|nr:MAG: glutaminase [Bacteroidota bacterium]
MNYQRIIEDLYRTILREPDTGSVAAYIPELSAVDPDKFGIYLTTVENENFGTGDCHELFSIQSIAKVLSLSLAYNMLGGELWKRVGVEPSGSAFNSLVQLEYDAGIPRNPFINAGAIVICDILQSLLQDPKNDLLQFIREVSGLPGLDYSPEIAASERSQGYRNMALIHFIKSFGNIQNDIEPVIDLYFHLCSIRMSCAQLTRTFLFLANNGRDTRTGQAILNMSQTKRINAIMQTCGFYDEAGEFAYTVGLPGKSGVGGGIVAVHPNKYCIAVWSPRLNRKGNSQRGMWFLEQFTTETQLSIF